MKFISLTNSLQLHNVDNSKPLYLFVMAGQSNMVGGVEIPPNLPAVSGAYIFGNNDIWKDYSDPYDDPSGQIDSVSYDALFYLGLGVGAGYGPARSFVTKLLTLRPDIQVGLIPCAKGASSIAQWQRNLSSSTLYGSCLRRTRLALTIHNSVLGGFLFFQGEQDATSIILPSQWSTQFTQMVNDFRTDLALPTLPVIFTKLPTRTAPHPWYPYWDDVRTNQLTVSIPNTYRIDFEDIDVPLTSDLYASAHLTLLQYDIVGERWADNIAPLIP